MQAVPVSAGRFVKQSQGLTNAAGICTITFEPPPLGYTQTGSITIYGSPLGALWTINLGGVPVDNTVGNATVGNIQCQGTDVITLVAPNLRPGVIIQASYVGIMDISANVPFVGPNTDSGQAFISGAARVALLINNYDLNNQPLTAFAFNLLPTERSIVVVPSPHANNQSTAGGWDITYTASGGITNATYGGKTNTEQNVALGSVINTVALPLYGLADPIGNLFISGAPDGVTGSPALMNFIILAVPDEITTGTTPGSPTYVELVSSEFGTDTGHVVTATTGTDAVLLAAPPNGLLWKVSHVALNATTTASAASVAGIHLTSTGAYLILEYAAVGGIAFWSQTLLYLGEGLTLHNTTPVSASAYCVAQLVSLD